MGNLINNIRFYFKKKRLNVFVTFLMLALLFSLLTKLSSNYTKSISFQLNPINVPEDIVIINDSLQKIDIVVTTFGFRLFKYYFNKPEIDIDFSNLEATKSQYIWTTQRERQQIVSQFNPKDDIGIINPDTILFSYSKNGVKMIPIILNQDITFSAGYNLYEDLKIMPDSIKVIGPKSIIDTIKMVQTEIAILEDVNKNISQSIKLKLPKLNSNIIFSDSEVMVKGKVERFTEGSVDVPVNIINVPEDIKLNYYPKTIPVIFSTTLDKYKLINSGSFLVECDFNEIKKDNSYLTPKIKRTPETVKYVRLDVKRVEFILVK